MAAIGERPVDLLCANAGHGLGRAFLDDAMKAGKGDVVSGWGNKLTVAMAHVTPAGMLAEQHRKMAEPGTAEPAED